MQAWKNESAYANMIAENWASATHQFSDSPGFEISPASRRDHLNNLEQIYELLRQLQPHISHRDYLKKRLDQLKSYIHSLKTSKAPENAESQFNQLYALRKWLFWVPISVTQSRAKELPAMVLLAYFYAIAIALEPMFPKVGPAFCSDMALLPLEEIIRDVSSLRMSERIHQQPVSVLMEFPRQIATTYRGRRNYLVQYGEEIPVVHSIPYELQALNTDLESQIAEYTMGDNNSPAFVPSPLQTIGSGFDDSRAASPYLGLPRAQVGTHGFGASRSVPYAIPPELLRFAPVADVPDQNVLSFTTYGAYSGFVYAPQYQKREAAALTLT